MTYINCNIVKGGSLESYDQVNEALPSTEPDGLLARYAGMSDGALVITAVWASKAHSDRFSAELLGPTIARLQPNQEGMTVDSFDYRCHDTFVAATPPVDA